MRDAQPLTTTPPPAATRGDASTGERDARLFSYKRTAAESRIGDLFTALEAGDGETARQHAEDLLYTIRRAATFKGIGLNVRLAG